MTLAIITVAMSIAAMVISIRQFFSTNKILRQINRAIEEEEVTTGQRQRVPEVEE